jgi:hypothetical protein
MRTHTGPGDNGTLRCLLADTLGSTSTILSATATVLESSRDGLGTADTKGKIVSGIVYTAARDATSTCRRH